MKNAFFLTIFIGLSFLSIDHFSFDFSLAKEKWSILLFFAITSLYFLRILHLAFRDERKNLVSLIIVYKTLKLLLCMTYIVIMLYIGVANPLKFIIAFFILYLFYTGFEILEYNRKLRQN